MRYALAEELALAVFGVGVDQVVIAGKGGKVDDIGLGDGATGTFDAIAHLEFVEIEPARAGQTFGSHRHWIRSPVAGIG